MEKIMRQSVITCEVKEVAPRVLEFIGSTETKDRQGDIVRASGWNLKNYKKNPLFMWAHDYSSPPIGRAVKVWVKDNQLMFHIEFADKDTYEFADTIYRLYKGGFLKATSVGFSPLDWEGKSGEDDMPAWGGNIFTEQELLELSGCPVPANPDALASAKTKRIISAKEYKTFNELCKQMMADEKLQEVVAEEVTEKLDEIIKPEVEVIPEKKEVSQAEIADEIDYLANLLQEYGLNEDNHQKAWDLVNTLWGCLPEIIERDSVSDITVEIETPPPAETLSEQDKEMVAHIITQTVNRVMEIKLGK